MDTLRNGVDHARAIGPGLSRPSSLGCYVPYHKHHNPYYSEHDNECHV
jgi:ethanolamine ammonia-lyase small subunit